MRIAVVTDLKGYLEPCGCTSRPLGGIDRMSAQIRALREGSTPLVLVLAGDLFFDTDALEPNRVDQAHRNARTLTQVLDDLQVTAALPGRRDRAQPDEVLGELAAKSTFPWLAIIAPVEIVQIQSGALRVAIVGVQAEAAPEAVAEALTASAEGADVTLALTYGSRRQANRIAALDGVDFVIEGGLDQDEPVAPRTVGEASVLHAGRQGQGLTVVELTKRADGAYLDRSSWSRQAQAGQLDERIAELSEKIAAWEKQGDVARADIESQTARLASLRVEREGLDAPTPEAMENTFDARWVELPNDAPTDPAVTARMKKHDAAVNEANRLAFADLEPKPLGANDVAYVGSSTCNGCHAAAYGWWRTTPHGRAYRTLQERNKEYNLDCVGCHVTGYDQPGGSTVSHNLDGMLVDVGCETCHGPGGAHLKDPTVAMVTDPPESTCVPCHNEEHSDAFDYETYKKTMIVPGHGLPVTEN